MEERIAGRFEKARVKHVTAHKKEPLALVAMYNGEFELWNTASMLLIKSGSIGEIPIRAAAFIEDCECFVLGSDDGMIRLYCIDTFKIKCKVQAHSDFIRYIAVHPVLPYIATCSDDMQVKIWDYSKEISLIKTLTGHTHFVMSGDFSPQDNKTLLTCSLDHNIIAWNIETGNAAKILKGTKVPLNTVKYIKDKYIISGGDDGKINVWDSATYNLVTSVAGHIGPVTAIHCTNRGFISTGEDGIVREWDKKRFRPETATPGKVQRIWSVCSTHTGGALVGGDEGISFIKQMQSTTLTTFITTGKTEGRIVIAENTQVKQIKTANPSAQKVVTTLSFLPDRIALSETGRYLCVESDNMVYVYTVLGFLLQVSVPGHSLVWTGPEEFLMVYKDALVRYCDFEIDQKIELPEIDSVKSMVKVNNDELLLKTESMHYLISMSGVVLMEVPDVQGVYKYKDVYVMFYKNRVEIFREGERNSNNKSAQCVYEFKISGWGARDNVIFIHTGGKIVYVLITQPTKNNLKMQPVSFMSLSATGEILGVLDGVWCMDGGNVFEYEVDWELVKYQNMIVSGSMPEKIPNKYVKECIHFLVGMNMLEDAYKLADDPDEKFELLIKLGRLNDAMKISDTEAKYSRLSTLFVQAGKVSEALACAKKGLSVENEILLASLSNSVKDIGHAAEKAYDQGKSLAALAAGYRSENYKLCLDILKGTEFESLFAQTHAKHLGKQDSLKK
ncbi:coatomer subunit beta' [Nematocida parisii]|nr:coatomer subunit beta' [Nematocida parisii]KAI5127653.1 coatomer subunit beta' [Nematocida parisii]KAI5141206.1 coatomer subunit beta' [Nematocida parisii]